MPLKSRGFKGASAVYGSSLFGESGPLSRVVNRKTGITDNTATSFLRITCPNISDSGLLSLLLLGSVRSSGSTYLESARVARMLIAFNRIPGANLVATAASIEDAAIATGGTETLTMACAVASVSGGITAVNTIDVQITLDSSNSSPCSLSYVADFLVNGTAAKMSIASV